VTIFLRVFHSFVCRVLRKDGVAIGVHPIFVIYIPTTRRGLSKVILNELDLTTNGVQYPVR